MIIPVILAGGSGSRLWPLSRQLFPKQLMNLMGGETMLQSTFQRICSVEDVGRPIIICNENHRFMVAEQARNINMAPSAIILEPFGRNTAPAIAVGALKALEEDKDSTIIVMPADHYIKNVKPFHDAVKIGADYARSGWLVTFGIVPHAPETGYGYIQKGKPADGVNENANGFTIRKFVEKPDLATAERYLTSGDYFWNSGIFMFKASAVLTEMKKFVPDIVDACISAYEKGKADLDFFRLDADAFKTCPGNSIDYAVMEKTDKGVMTSLDAGWSDLGSWEALWQVGDKDNHNNVISGDVIQHDVKDSYLHSTGRMIAAIGLEKYIVVETPDAVLISPRERGQEVKHIVDQLKKKHRKEGLTHKKDYRPWGTSENIDNEDRFLVNRVMVKPGAKLSLHQHIHRAEHWIVVKGTALVTKGDECFILKEDQSTYIPLGVAHRLENPGKIPLEIIEVHSGSYLGKEDINRIEDVYGRKD